MQIIFNISTANEQAFMDGMLALHPKPDPNMADSDYIATACAVRLCAGYKTGTELKAVEDAVYIENIVTTP